MLKIFKVFYFTFLFGLISIAPSLVAMEPQAPAPLPAAEPELSAQEKAEVEEALRQLPETLREAQQAVEQSNRDLADLRKDMAAKPLNEAIFEIPIVGNNFFVGVYKQDLVRFVFQLCDFGLDKFFFKQMQNHYQQKVLSGFKDKTKLLVEALDSCDDVAQLGTVKVPLLNEVFVSKCVNILNVDIKFNLKWFLHLLFNFGCKHYLAEMQESWMGGGVLNFGYAATSAGGLINQIGNAANVGLAAVPVAGNPNAALNAQINGIIDEFKNKKIKMSIFPLVDFLVFGHLPIDIRVENTFKSVVWMIRILDFYWFNNKHQQSINFLNSKKFFMGAKLLGVFMFLRNSCTQYQLFLKYYLKKNMHLFLKILSDVKFASSSNQESYAEAEKKLKDFIKGSEVAFDSWKVQKNLSRNTIFLLMGTLAIYAIEGTFLYLLWRKSCI